MKKIIIFYAVLIAATCSAQAEVSCEYQPGKRACSNIRITLQNYSWRCRGRSCDAIFQQRINSLHNLASSLISLPGGTVSKNLGQKAKQLAHKICRSTSGGDYNIILSIVQAENTVLAELKILQESADVSTYTCQRSI